MTPNRSQQPANQSDAGGLNARTETADGHRLAIDARTGALTVLGGPSELKDQKAEFAPEVHDQLLKARNAFPFVPVVPFCQNARTVAVDNTAALDINLPSGTLICRISTANNAVMLAAAGTPGAAPLVGQGADGVTVIAPGAPVMYYVGNMRQLTIRGLAAALSFVSFEFFLQR